MVIFVRYSVEMLGFFRSGANTVVIGFIFFTPSVLRS